MPDTTIIQVIGDESEVEVLTTTEEVVTEVDESTVVVEETTMTIEVGADDPTVIVEETETVVVEESTDVEIIENVGVGPQGPKGDKGDPGSGSQIVQAVRVAAVDLSGHRAVVAKTDGKVEYANWDDPGPQRPVWVTTESALADENVTVVMHGLVTEPSWSWTPELPVYLSSNGILTQTVPTTGAGATFTLIVGVAEASDKLFVEPGFPIVLE